MTKKFSIKSIEAEVAEVLEASEAEAKDDLDSITRDLFSRLHSIVDGLQLTKGEKKELVRQIDRLNNNVSLLIEDLEEAQDNVISTQNTAKRAVD